MFWEPPLQNWIGYESFLGFHLWGKLELTQYAPEPKIVPEKPTMIRFHWNVQDGIAFSHNKPPAKCSATLHPNPKCHLLTIWKIPWMKELCSLLCLSLYQLASLMSVILSSSSLSFLSHKGLRVLTDSFLSVKSTFLPHSRTFKGLTSTWDCIVKKLRF